jgi:hypothetical protein
MFTQGYVGITSNIKGRLEQHKNRTRNAHLKNAIEKYGWDKLIKDVVLIADRNYCLVIEKALRSLSSIGWNIAEGGSMPPIQYGNTSGLGKPAWNKGIPHPEETKEKLSLALMGRKTWNKGLKTPDEVKAKQSLVKTGKPGNRAGKTNSPEHRAAISKAKIGRRLSPEIYKQQALKRVGYKHKLVTCPHCNKIGGITAMPRWHFDNCKEKQQWQA